MDLSEEVIWAQPEYFYNCFSILEGKIKNKKLGNKPSTTCSIQLIAFTYINLGMLH